MTTGQQRLLITGLWAVTGLPTLLIWFLFGLVSMRTLSAVLLETGRRLQRYDW